MLRVRELSVRFQTKGSVVAAADRVSFDLERGGSLALLGESGSGKSTVLLALLGLLPPSAQVTGEVAVGGDTCLRRARGKRIGLVFSDALAALDPVMQVGAQLAEAGGDPAALLRAVGLSEEAGGAFAHQLSGGMRQRVAIALALAGGATVLAADEPTSALDPVARAGIVRLLLDLRRERGIGLVLATHDLLLAGQLCERVAVMHAGRIVETGPTRELLARPAHPRTAALVQSAPPPLGALPPPARDQAAPALLRVESLRVHRGGRRVLDGVSFALHAGEMLGVVGESGSGKTTLARAALRLIEPSSGRVVWKGRDLLSLRPRTLRPLRREMQIVFQDAAASLDPRMTAGAAIREPLLIHGLDAGRARLAELLEAMELPPGVLRRLPHQLSSGQAQRVALARALATRPSLLVADEAFSALDVSLQAQLGALLSRLRAQTGFACLFITHDLRQAGRLCDRIAVLAGGALVETKSPMALAAGAAHPATRALIDASRA